jgi:hypothetical protein
VGDRLVFWGYDTYAVDPSNLNARPETISHGSWFFVPAADPNRVWVVWKDDSASTSTHFVFSSVREIATDGKVIKQGPAHGSWWLDGAIEAGPVFQTSTGLAVWDPQQHRVLGRIEGASTMGASFRDSVVWCNRCSSLHFTNPITGSGHTVHVPGGYGAFYVPAAGPLRQTAGSSRCRSDAA